MTTMPNMWVSEKLGIHRRFYHIERHKLNGAVSKQKATGSYIISGMLVRPNNIVSIDGDTYTTKTMVHITSITDRGDYYYIGHEPIGKDCGSYSFGYTRLYKNKTTNFGTIAFEEVPFN